MDVRKALEILGRQANLSILVSSGVGGRVTLDLRDKTADEILQAIARLCRLTIRREKDVIYVTALDEREKEEDDLPVRVYHLNYVRSSDVEDDQVAAEQGARPARRTARSDSPATSLHPVAAAGAAGAAEVAAAVRRRCRRAETPWPAAKSWSSRTTNKC